MNSKNEFALGFASLFASSKACLVTIAVSTGCTYVRLRYVEWLSWFPILMLTFVSVTTEVWAINKGRLLALKDTDRDWVKLWRPYCHGASHTVFV